MITLKSPLQIAAMRRAGALLYEVLQTVKDAVKPGVSTLALNDLAERLIRNAGAEPSFLGYEGFPASLCTSVDSRVVHGIPSAEEILREGSIISLDCGLVLNGWQADSALTVPVGRVSDEMLRLIRVTEDCFFAGAREAAAGHTIGDIGQAVADTAHAAGFTSVRDLTGHGIGREMHEEPTVYLYGQAGHGLRLRGGMTIAIEPMIAAGDWHVDEEDDGWGVVTHDGSPASHYEHTLAISDGLPELLTLPGYVWKEDA
ncbi:MAG: type I methionyl aminopeptidase [Clostridia bacterium]|nr:type I methionyl aminopeptidase [Clostridia bacterium]